MDEMIVLAMIVCAGLALIGYKMRMWPVTFISSLGWLVIAMDLFKESEDYLVLGLLLMLSITQVICVKEAERWPSISP